MEFEEYVRARGPALLRFAFVLSGNQHEAEDLTQSALEDALTHWRAVARADHPDRYMQRVLLNRFLQARRRRSSSEVLSADLGAYLSVDRLPHGQDAAFRVGDRDEARQLLASLPPRARAVVVLRYYLDLDERSTAELLGMATGTVRSSLSRSLASLRRDAVRPHVPGEL